MNEQSNSIITKICDVIDNLGRLQTVRSVIGAVVCIIVFLACIFAFRQKINRATKAQIRKFVKEGKYLPATYVELHGGMEVLRYFVFSHRWKRRVIKQYNHLFEGYEGKRLKTILPSGQKYRLSTFCSISKIRATLEYTQTCLKNLRNDREKHSREFGEAFWAIRNSTYYHVYAIEHLQELISMISEKNIILVGSAGNGKTSLLCRISEIIIANKMPCLLINARDIKEDCVSYVMGKLFPSKHIDGKKEKYLLRLVSIILSLQRKHLYILVDAINENNREVFTDSIAKLPDVFSSHKRIRILFTCRHEYFDTRYKILFSFASIEPYIFRLPEAHYDERAMQKMIQVYSNYYNVHGPLSLEMQEKLMNSLLLTRLFFEVNSNRNECTLEFRNAEIYKLYFERVAAKNKKIDLAGIVDKIAELMVQKFSFDAVPMEELCLSADDLDAFQKVLDNNLIISHSVRVGRGITEREEEYVYFVFDELRDFCLARYLLMFDERNQNNDYTGFFAQANQLFEQRLSPIEGVIKYAYHHFREAMQYDLCEKTLSSFGESDVQEICDRKNFLPRSNRRFNCLGFSLIFAEGAHIQQFEMEYIAHCIEGNCKYYWDMCWYLLGNEYSRFEPNIEFAVRILGYWQSDETPQKILKYFFADRSNKHLPYYDESHRIDNLIDWVNHIETENGRLSAALKALLVILAAYDPAEYKLRDYHVLVLDETVCTQLSEQIKCKKLLASIQKLKEQAATHRARAFALRQVLCANSMEENDE